MRPARISCGRGAASSIGGDAWSAGNDTATGNGGSRLTSGGSVDVASSGGDVNILGAISSWVTTSPAPAASRVAMAAG